MEKVIKAVTSTPKGGSKNDDTFADRLSSRYTVIVLIVFALVVSTSSFFRKFIYLPFFIILHLLFS